MGSPGSSNDCDIELFLQQQFVPPFDRSSGHPRDDVWVALAWAVKNVKQTAAADANMILKFEYVDIAEYKVAVPFLTNNKPIKKYQVA